MPKATNNFERIFYLSKVFIEINKKNQLLNIQFDIHDVVGELMVWYMYAQREYGFYTPVRIYENKYIIGSKVPCGIWMNDLIFSVVFVWWTKSYLHLYAKFLKGQYWFVIQLYCCVFLCGKRKLTDGETLLLVGLIWGYSCFVWNTIKFLMCYGYRMFL